MTLERTLRTARPIVAARLEIKRMLRREQQSPNAELDAKIAEYEACLAEIDAILAESEYAACLDELDAILTANERES